jgi:hypothetical protein
MQIGTDPVLTTSTDCRTTGCREWHSMVQVRLIGAPSGAIRHRAVATPSTPIVMDGTSTACGARLLRTCSSPTEPSAAIGATPTE